jgi:sulfate transport system ATP-binding protein
VTSVFVTHDQEEALELADRVVVMNEGRIEQIGSPDEVFHHPRTEFVMNFLGQVNLFGGRLENGRIHFATLAWDSPEHAELPAQSVKVFVRPHDVEVSAERNGKASFRATVLLIHSAGPNVRLELAAESGERLFAELPQESFRAQGIAPGSQVFVTPHNVHVFAGGENGVGIR